MRLRSLVLGAFCLFACGLGVSGLGTQAAEPKTVLLLGQRPDGHAAGSHEYVAGLQTLAELLGPCAELKVQLVNADEPWTEGPQLLREADGAVLFLAEGARWCQADPRRYEALTQLAARGGGLVALHWAIGTKKAEPIEPFLKLLGGCHGGPDRKYQVLETELSPATPEHPITAGLASVRVRDEFYYRLKFIDAQPPVQPLMRATIDGQAETVAWTWQRPDGGRSFGFSGLHFHQNWQRPEYRELIRRAVLWSMGIEDLGTAKRQP